MHLGGMLDDKKSELYALVPQEYLPKTTIVDAYTKGVSQKLESSQLNFPLIIKPDVGYKGFLVRKIDNIQELEDSLSLSEGRSMLIQEYLTHPKEYSVMCYCDVNTGRYAVSSLVEKHLPFVIGDGQSTLLQLIDKKGSAFLSKKWIIEKLGDKADRVIDSKEKVIIDHIGNYARGAKFEDLNLKIDDRLITMINDFFDHVEGVNFGRLDVKAESLDELFAGRFKLLEINGAKAEPIHIYDPKVTFVQIIRDISFHWKTLFHIVKNNRSDKKYPSLSDGLKSLRSLKKSVG